MTQPTITIDVKQMVNEAIERQIKSFNIENSFPTVMSLKAFCRTQGVSHNFVMEHKDEFCVFKIGGKVLINMVAWREKLKAQK